MIGQTAQAVAVGLLGMATSQNKHGEISGFLAMCGAGIGLTIGTLEMQSRFLLPKEQNSVSTTMNLFVSFFPFRPHIIEIIWRNKLLTGVPVFHAFSSALQAGRSA